MEEKKEKHLAISCLHQIRFILYLSILGVIGKVIFEFMRMNSNGPYASLPENLLVTCVPAVVFLYVLTLVTDVVEEFYKQKVKQTKMLAELMERLQVTVE